MTASRALLGVPIALLILAGTGCGRSPAAPAPTPQRPATGPTAEAADTGAARGPAGAAAAQPRPYNRVVTAGARTQDGWFKTHRIGERLLFEIPRQRLGHDMMVAIRNSAGGAATGFFGGGPTRYVSWDREGNRIVLRERTYDVYADPDSTIAWAVGALRAGTILAAFNVEAWGPDSAAVIDVSRLFTTNIPRWVNVTQIQTDRSFLHAVHAFPDAVNVEAWQTGMQPAPATGGGPPGGQAGPAQQVPVTALVSYSMRPLPQQTMRPRLWDPRVGIGSVRTIDYSRPEHRAEERRYIRRFRLEPREPGANLSEPREPIVFWIDRATPEWLVPWVRAGVEEWLPAYEEAGFRNAIEGRLAPRPDEDPSFNIFDARRNAIYWRPSTVANATGGQVVDPRTGEILKAEVNMYHNIMNLLRNWYFVQVSPLDPRAQTLPLPDSLMGRLVQYVVAHEIGHAIGFPHNMKASAMFPADSIRSVSFLRRKGSHVATLMDYSRMNYVAQPEDNIPPELLIPTVGPYDRFAIMWQNRVIPGAATPDAERPMLNQWASMQDTIPWFRFSTGDATADPFDLTEAVGDEDAVKSSRLGLLNLERVANSLIRVAERPGEDYSMLAELYGNTVSQWGRYNGHVAAIVGGAETQERLGTGPRFSPLPRARQQEAIRFLNENAFRVPVYLKNPEILRRIEQEGMVRRVRQAQAGVLASLFSKSRLDRLVEYEAMAGPRGDFYAAGDMLADVRRGVWTELSQSSVRIDVYRRNLQRAYLEAIDRTLNPPEPTGPTAAQQRAQRWESDARPLLRGELAELDRTVAAALARAGDNMTRLHLRDVRLEIERLLDTSR
jgi:hypothetical protein